MKYLSLLVFLCISPFLFAQEGITETYINKYKQIAIYEMHRTGIPSSITLAQGLLESNWGRSTLAVKSNNHFGIKCSGDYSGKNHMRHDDEFNEFGKKKKSCFRVYDSAEDSFYDHSEFLIDNNKSKRYGFLFEYSSSDYHSWAKGLSKSGYATDPKYANKLISIIDKHELWRYDQEMEDAAEVIVSLKKSDPNFSYKITYMNACKIVFAQGGEHTKDLAKVLGVSSRSIVKFNSSLHKSSDVLKAGQKIFLEEKKEYYLGKEKEHLLEIGHDIAFVSNLYGIDEAYLREINHLKKGEELSNGSTLLLQYKGRKKKRTKSTFRKRLEDNGLLADNSDYLFDKALEPFRK